MTEFPEFWILNSEFLVFLVFLPYFTFIFLSASIVPVAN